MPIARNSKIARESQATQPEAPDPLKPTRASFSTSCLQVLNSGDPGFGLSIMKLLIGLCSSKRRTSTRSAQLANRWDSR